MRRTRAGTDLVVLAWLVAALASCSRSPEPRLVLYTSADDALARDVIDAFQAETGIRVDLATDTEATKTTGLVERLIREAPRPRADVWWSSEVLGTMRLAREGVLAPMESLPDWPLRDETWLGFAQRARVIAYSGSRVKDPPRSLSALTESTWTRRVGMARPRFGTTRGHMAVLVEAWGPEAFEAWLEALVENGLLLYDGNAAVVRAIAQGEIDVGLTDTDDVWAAVRNRWDVRLTTEVIEREDPSGWTGFGTLLIPNTVAIVKGAPNEPEARRFVEFLVSAPNERRMADSDSRNIPVREAVRAEYPNLVPDEVSSIDLNVMLEFEELAMEICDRVLD
ncbi:MAG: extracellular solute-binding protein [Phycisphaerales bacterium]|nr:extracellular solute-binding protein [Phycisphaerales bacterium]